MKKLQLIFVLLFFTNSQLFAQLKKSSVFKAPKEFHRLKSAIDSTYGYTINNPIRIKKGGSLNTEYRMYDFLFCLRINENKILSQNTLNTIETKSGYVYEFNLSVEDSDKKVKLYFDTKEEQEIRIPVGLKIDTTTHTIPTYRNFKKIR